MKIIHNHRNKIILGIVVFFLILVMKSPFGIFLNPLVLINMGFNNILLWNFQNQLFNYPLPKGAEVVKKESKIGILQGNGNHCDFEARLTLKSDNSSEIIIEHYSAMEINPAFGGVNFHKRIKEIERGVVTIIIGDSHYDSGMDFRCY